MFLTDDCRAVESTSLSQGVFDLQPRQQLHTVVAGKGSPHFIGVLAGSQGGIVYESGAATCFADQLLLLPVGVQPELVGFLCHVETLLSLGFHIYDMQSAEGVLQHKGHPKVERPDSSFFNL